MLQIKIIHNEKEHSVYTQRIIDLIKGTTLSKFDEDTQSINLFCLKTYIGENVLITHYNKEDNELVFSHEDVKKLVDVAQDENEFWYYSYV